MKRCLFFLLAIPLLLAGCRDLNSELDDIKSRLTELEGTRISSIYEQINQIKTTIQSLDDAKASLEGKDMELDAMIKRLQTYVDESLSKESDWIKATYATLDQYMALSNEVAALKESLTTEDGGSKLAALENSLKSWVGEALTGYYDIATMDAKLSALATQESVQKDMEKVRSEIGQAKEEMTAAYKKAISDAIELNNGVIDRKIAEEIGKVQARLDKALADINAKIDGLELRIKALEELTAGLKVSDSVFGFVLYTQVDTITKGLKFPVSFRVNPSGVPFTQDMVVLDNMSSTKYLVMEEETRASYITESKNFYVDSLGKTRNAAEQEMDGQYFIRLGNRETRNLIDDNLFSLVGAYKDKEGVVQYVSSNPFHVVMMPNPAEGLTPWMYGRGNVTRLKQIIIPSGKEGEDATIRYEKELGAISFSLDPRTYKQENGEARQTYSTRKYIRQLSFEPATAADSLVVFMPVRDSGFVRFLPDTSKAEMRALMDTTQLRSITVRGKIHALDRFGGQAEFPVEMTWYSEFRDTLTVEKKASDFFTTDSEGEVVRKSVLLNLEDEFKKLGYYAYEASAARRKTVNHFMTNGGSSRFILYNNTDAASDEEGTVTAVIKGMGPKEKMPGTYYLSIVNMVNIAPNKETPSYEEEQITAVLTVKLVVTE